MSKRIRLQAGARQRASTDYAPQPPPPSESAWAHRGVDGGRPGDRRPPLFCVCVSTWSRTSATESFDEQVHTTSSEGAHVSPPALGTSSGTGWTSPSPLARSDARLLAEGALRGRASATDALDAHAFGHGGVLGVTVLQPGGLGICTGRTSHTRWCVWTGDGPDD